MNLTIITKNLSTLIVIKGLFMASIIGLLGCIPRSGSKLNIIGGSLSGEAFPAVVGISVQKEICTGTFIRDDLMITAAHCFIDGGAMQAEIKGWGSVEPLYKTSLKVKLHPENDPSEKYDSTGNFYKDIALVWFPKGTSSATVALSSNTPAQGSSVLFLGFGCTSYKNMQSDTKRRMGRNKIFDVTQEYIYLVGAADQVDGSFSENGLTCPGDSGGSLFDSSGNVIGILWGGGEGNSPETLGQAISWFGNINHPKARSFIQSEVDNSAEVPATDNGADGSSNSTTASDGYSYCTNNSDTGGGWGWDTSLNDPKGGHSCHVRTFQTGSK